MSKSTAELEVFAADTLRKVRDTKVSDLYDQLTDEELMVLLSFTKGILHQGHTLGIDVDGTSQ